LLFQSFWNLIEMGIVAVSLGAIILYFYRLFETNRLTSEFHKSQGLGYIKFQYVGYWNEVCFINTSFHCNGPCDKSCVYFLVLVMDTMKFEL
jgi:hypothetical protein